MQIQFEKKEKSSALLTISLEQQDYLADYQSKLKDYSKKAQMKGFRPGKVPPALIERMYGPALKSDAINSVLNKSIDHYLKENEIKVLGDMIAADSLPPAEDEAQAGILSFSFSLALRPEVQFPAPESISLEFPEISVSEDRISSFIEDMQKRYGEVQESDTIAESSLIKGTLKSADGTFETESDFPFSRIKPGYQPQFLGKKQGDIPEFPIEEAFAEEDLRFVTNTFSDKGSNKEFKGLYSLEIKKITDTIPAQLDPGFYAKVVGGNDIETEEEFRQKVKDLFLATYEEEAKTYFQMALEKYLLRNSVLEIPEDIISRIISDRGEGKFSQEELSNFLPQYLHTLRMNLIREAIATTHQIRISREDVFEQAREKVLADLKQMGLGQLDDEFMNRFVENYLNDKEKRNEEQMAERALTAKIAALISEKGKIVRKSVSIEEFNKLVEELN